MGDCRIGKGMGREVGSWIVRIDYRYFWLDYCMSEMIA
jgi:hypothetical protein